MSAESKNIQFCYNDYQYGHSHVAIIRYPRPHDAVAVGFPKVPVLAILVKNQEDTVIKSIAMMNVDSYGYAYGDANDFDHFKAKPADTLRSERKQKHIKTFFAHLAEALYEAQCGDIVKVYCIGRETKFSRGFFPAVSPFSEIISQAVPSIYEIIEKSDMKKCRCNLIKVHGAPDSFALTGDGRFVKMLDVGSDKLSEEWPLKEADLGLFIRDVSNVDGKILRGKVLPSEDLPLMINELCDDNLGEPEGDNNVGRRVFF